MKSCFEKFMVFLVFLMLLQFFSGRLFAQHAECQWEISTKGGKVPHAILSIDSGSSIEVECSSGCDEMTAYDCREWKGPQGAYALHFRAFGNKDDRAFEVFVALQGGGLKLVWSGITGMDGEPGEREGFFIDYEPVMFSKGESLYPVLYRLDEKVQICGFGPAPLEVKMFDPASASFRNITFDRLRRVKKGLKKWWGRGMENSEKIVDKKSFVQAEGSFNSLTKESENIEKLWPDVLIFESSSSSIGSDGSVMIGQPQFSLGDGNGDTGWIEGSGGDGDGEFVTMKTISPDLPVEGLSFILVPPSAINKFGALKKFSIVTDDRKIYTVSVNQDPRKSPDAVFDINFPQPLKTRCFTLIIDEVWKAQNDVERKTFIGEITAKVAINSGEKIAGLLNGLIKSGNSTGFQRVLSVMPCHLIDFIATGWELMDEKAKEFLFLNIPLKLLSSDTNFVLTLKILQWIRGNHNLSPESILKFVKIAAESDLPWLKLFDFPPGIDAWHLSLFVLGYRGFDEAVLKIIEIYLMDSGGSGGKNQEFSIIDKVDVIEFLTDVTKKRLLSRDKLVQAQAGEKQGSYAYDWCDFLTEHFYGQTPASRFQGSDLSSADYSRIKKIALLYPLYLSGHIECAGEIARGMWEGGGNSFEESYYLLELLAKLISAGCKMCLKELENGGIVFQALSNEDEQIRIAALAVVSVAGKKGEVALREVEKLLEDPCPQVRAEAIALLANTDWNPGRKIVKIALNDFWPEVRKEAVKSAFKVKEISEDEIVLLLNDPSFDVKKEAIELVLYRRENSKRVGEALIEIAKNNGVRWDVREEAAMAIGKLLIRGFEKELENIAFDGLYPDSTESQIYAATAAIASLGMLGWKKGMKLLSRAILPGLRLELRIAAMEAMACLGTKEGIEMLNSLTSDSNLNIKSAAIKIVDELKKGIKPSTCMEFGTMSASKSSP